MKNLTGTLGILNVGEGDVTISFDPKNPAERKRAATIVTDMLRRGFAILVKVGEQDGEPIFKRAKKFDPATCEYIVAGDAQVVEPKSPTEKPTRAKSQPTQHRVPAERTHAVSVSRSAGGYDPVLPDRIRRGLKSVESVIG